MLATLDTYPMPAPRAEANALAYAKPATAPRTSPPAFFDRAGTATVRRIEAREHVFCEGDPRTHVFQVEDGAIVIYKVLPDGRRQVMGFAYKGDLIGLGNGKEHVFNAQAAGAARVRCMGAQALEDAATRDAALAIKLYKAVSLELTAARNLLISIGQHSALERVASFLLTLYQRNEEPVEGHADGHDASVIHLPMRRSDIADFLGLTIETVSRTLTKMRIMDVIEIEHGTEIHVLDPDKLADLTMN